MAEAFKATCSGPGGFERTVVVKRILPANCEDPEFLRMFTAEAKILGMLHHPNVVQVYDFGEADGTLFLVLEFVDGPSLGRLLRVLRNAGRPMPVAIAAHFAREVCRALDYVHGLRGSDGEPLNVIHRDVTPSNVVVTPAGSLKLLDFGIAKYGTSEAQTQNHYVKGKPAYLAPEIIEGGLVRRAGRPVLRRCRPARAADLGAPVRRRPRPGDLANKVLSMPIAAPSRTRPEVPAALDAIVMKALQRDRARRYASAAEMARDLDQFVVASHLHNDEVVAFLRGVEPLLNQPPGSAAMRAASVGSMATSPRRPPSSTWCFGCGCHPSAGCCSVASTTIPD